MRPAPAAAPTTGNDHGAENRGGVSQKSHGREQSGPRGSGAICQHRKSSLRLLKPRASVEHLSGSRLCPPWVHQPGAAMVGAGGGSHTAVPLRWGTSSRERLQTRLMFACCETRAAPSSAGPQGG